MLQAFSGGKKGHREGVAMTEADDCAESSLGRSIVASPRKSKDSAKAKQTTELGIVTPARRSENMLTPSKSPLIMSILSSKELRLADKLFP